MLNMIYHLYKSDKINIALSCLFESRPIELKVSISKFIGHMTRTFLGSCVYPRLVLNLPMLSKSLQASIRMSV